MIFSLINRILLIIIVNMLIGCSELETYAPVKDVNQVIAPVNGYVPHGLPRLATDKQGGQRSSASTNIQSPKTVRLRPTANDSVFVDTDKAVPPDYSTARNLPARAKTAPDMAISNKKADKLQINKENMAKTPPDRYLLMPKPAVNEPKKPQKATILNLQDIEKNKNSHLISNTNIISVKNNSVGITKKLDNLQITEKNSKKSIISINNKKLLKLNFQWPLKGKLTRSFSQTDNKGIQISGKNGQTVVAAEAGKAVYCGHGLAGLGNVAIIKHNETFLSAYANNSRLVVKEGQQVGKGQAIGQLGQTGLKKATLHFEIRKNGKPINPLMLLPKN